jgi:hypothetical protein
MNRPSQTTSSATQSQSSDAADPTPSESPSPDAETAAARQSRLQVLRAQQAASQMSKSEGELRGVQSEFGQIIAELINNRVDSQDRRERLQNKVHGPLTQLVKNDWPPFGTEINALEKLVAKESAETVRAKLESVITKNNELIARLTGILGDMIDMQDFNEVVDEVRRMLDDQNKLIDQTKQEKKRRELELLK